MGAAVEVADVARRFGAVEALAGVDLTVDEGEFFGLLGPNGAGKTTLISILAGLTRADRGTARVLGHDVRTDYRNARRLLGVVPQELVFDPFFSVRETLRIQAGYFGLRKNDAWIDEILHHLDLTSKADANMRSLSGGMKRRVLVGQALVHKPPVIVLDEPTAGVDVELRQSLWGFIRKLNRDGHTIILTTHYLEEAEALCGRIAMLKAGRVVALDTTQNLLSSFAGLTVRLTAASLPDAWRERVLRHEGATYLLSLSSYAELENLLSALREHGVAITELALQEADLEQVFLRIMKRAA
jgi:ABC-2 type transport system ATP-binding protein